MKQMSKFEQHIAQCQEEGCKRAYETSKVDNVKALCSAGQFWFTDEDNMMPGGQTTRGQ